MAEPPSIPSTAAIREHPLHPLLVPFPIAFLVGALASDLAFLGSGDPFWARASAWLIGAGVVMEALAAVAGLTDFLGSNRVQSITAAWVHFLGNAIAMLLAIWNLVLRLGEGEVGRCPQVAFRSLSSSRSSSWSPDGSVAG
jgi:uncharacterized membrane protein